MWEGLGRGGASFVGNTVCLFSEMWRWAAAAAAQLRMRCIRALQWLFCGFVVVSLFQSGDRQAQHGQQCVSEWHVRRVSEGMSCRGLGMPHGIQSASQEG